MAGKSDTQLAAKTKHSECQFILEVYRCPKHDAVVNLRFVIYSAVVIFIQKSLFMIALLKNVTRIGVDCTKQIFCYLFDREM